MQGIREKTSRLVGYLVKTEPVMIAHMEEHTIDLHGTHALTLEYESRATLVSQRTRRGI